MKAELGQFDRVSHLSLHMLTTLDIYSLVMSNLRPNDGGGASGFALDHAVPRYI